MTTCPQDISWIRPAHRPQWTSFDTERPRANMKTTTVNDTWPEKQYVRPMCGQKSYIGEDEIKSLLEYHHPELVACRRNKPAPRRADRKYRPWSWEMCGARFWPWLTIEGYYGEELRLRHDTKMPHRRPLWPPEVKASPAVYAIEPFHKDCPALVRETCCAERPISCPKKSKPKFANFVNWQWTPSA